MSSDTTEPNDVNVTTRHSNLAHDSAGSFVNENEEDKGLNEVTEYALHDIDRPVRNVRNHEDSFGSDLEDNWDVFTLNPVSANEDSGSSSYASKRLRLHICTVVVLIAWFV